MRRFFLHSWFIAACLVVILPLQGPFRADASGETTTVEDQIAAILSAESAHEKIKVVVFDFGVSFSNPEKKLPENELKDMRDQLTEEFMTVLIERIKNSGNRDKISIIDRGKLDAVLREKSIPQTGPTELNATELSALAGIDVVITGRIQITGGSSTVTAKVVRVKDGEILSMVKRDKQERPSLPAQTPIALLDQIEKLKIGTWKALPVNLMYNGALDITIKVTQGNPIDVIVIPDSEYENVKNKKEVHPLTDFTSLKTKNYSRKAHLDSGTYHLILRDSSIGILSQQDSNIEIKVRLEP